MCTVQYAFVLVDSSSLQGLNLAITIHAYYRSVYLLSRNANIVSLCGPIITVSDTEITFLQSVNSEALLHTCNVWMTKNNLCVLMHSMVNQTLVN